MCLMKSTLNTDNPRRKGDRLLKHVRLHMINMDASEHVRPHEVQCIMAPTFSTTTNYKLGTTDDGNHLK